MNKSLILGAVVALALLGPHAEAAQAPGFFLRAEVGRTDIEASAGGFRANDFDRSTIFGGGYWFNANFGVEAHGGALYAKALGDYRREVDVDTAGVGVVAKNNFGSDGLGMFIGARVGVARMTAQVRVDGFELIDDAKSNKPYFGINAGYDFTPHFGLSLNFDRRSGAFDGGFDVDIDNVSVAGEVRF